MQNETKTPQVFIYAIITLTAFSPMITKKYLTCVYDWEKSCLICKVILPVFSTTNNKFHP